MVYLGFLEMTVQGSIYEVEWKNLGYTKLLVSKHFCLTFTRHRNSFVGSSQIIKNLRGAVYLVVLFKYDN